MLHSSGCCWVGYSVSLPTSILLGTDISERVNWRDPRTTTPGEQRAYVVTTRAKEATEVSKEQEERLNEEMSGVNPNLMEVEESSSTTTDREGNLGLGERD